MNLLAARLINRWLRLRKAGRGIHPLAAENLAVLDGLDPATPSGQLSYVVVDLETTGLDPNLDRVVSIGAFRVKGGVVKLGDAFCELINPGRDIPAESIKVHAVTPAMIEASRPAWEVFHDFLDWLGPDIMVAHYAIFDLHFINRVMKAQFGIRLQNLVLDTVLMCRTALIEPDPYGGRRGPKRCSLDSLAERFNIQVPDRHTAIGDAMATSLVLLCLLRELEKGGWKSLKDLVNVAGVW